MGHPPVTNALSAGGHSMCRGEPRGGLICLKTWLILDCWISETCYTRNVCGSAFMDCSRKTLMRSSSHDVLYYLPENSGAQECKVPLLREKIHEMEVHVEDDDDDDDDYREELRTYQDCFHFVMDSEHFFYPNTPGEAIKLFQKPLVIANR